MCLNKYGYYGSVFIINFLMCLSSDNLFHDARYTSVCVKSHDPNYVSAPTPCTMTLIKLIC